MISNFFVADIASAAPPPDSGATTFTTAENIQYELNFARTWYQNPVGLEGFGAVNIWTKDLWPGRTDGFMIYNMHWDLTPQDIYDTVGTVLYKTADYYWYNTGACQGSDVDTAPQCEFDRLGDQVILAVSKSTKRLVFVGTPVWADGGESGGLSIKSLAAGEALNLKSTNIVFGKKVYEKESPIIKKIINDMAKRVKGGAQLSIEAAKDPEKDLAGALQQIGSYTVRRQLSSFYFNQYFNKCDVNVDSSIYFGASDRYSNKVDTVTTPARDEVIKNPSVSNRPRIDIYGGADSLAGGYMFREQDKCDYPVLAKNGALTNGTEVQRLIKKRPVTTWVLDTTAKTGNEDYSWYKLRQKWADRAIFYFKMQPLGGTLDSDTQKINALKDYVYLAITVYGNEIETNFVYSSVGYDPANIVLKGIVQSQGEDTKYTLPHTFAINIAQFTFNTFSCSPKSITVLKSSSLKVGVVAGPNPRLSLSGNIAPSGEVGCKINSNFQNMDVTDVPTIRFSSSINDIQAADKGVDAAYAGYLSAWKIGSYITTDDGNGNKTMTGGEYNAQQNDNSCGCGEVEGANIMNILKRAFCAVICWTFNVGKGLQQNATCLFNDALGTVNRTVKAPRAELNCGS